MSRDLLPRVSGLTVVDLADPSLDGDPALECIMHVNLRRQVMLTHYLAAAVLGDVSHPAGHRGRSDERRGEFGVGQLVASVPG